MYTFFFTEWTWLTRFHFSVLESVNLRRSKEMTGNNHFHGQTMGISQKRCWCWSEGDIMVSDVGSVHSWGWYFKNLVKALHLHDSWCLMKLNGKLKKTKQCFAQLLRFTSKWMWWWKLGFVNVAQCVKWSTSITDEASSFVDAGRRLCYVGIQSIFKDLEFNLCYDQRIALELWKVQNVSYVTLNWV